MYYDKAFLEQLDKSRRRNIYARITLLTFDEKPIEFIEGKVTGGSVNIDGTSCLRRTCSLTMVTPNLDTNMYYLGLERKFKLEIGFENNIDDSYPNIIWFRQGVFITTDFNTSRSVSNYTISISGKDKMCMLNGDVSGTLPFSVDFATIENISEDGTTITYEQIKVKDIIRHAVEELGGELPHNIIINDLEESGLELLEYKGEDPIYLFRNESSANDATFSNFTLDGDLYVALEGDQELPEGYTAGQYFQLSELLDLGDLVDSFVDLGAPKTPIYFFFCNNATQRVLLKIYSELTKKILALSEEEIKEEETIIVDTIITNTEYYDQLLIDYSLDNFNNILIFEKNNSDTIKVIMSGTTTKELNNKLQIIFNSMIKKENPTSFSIVIAEYGDCVGYRQTDLVYAGDLVGDVGDSLTSILDKVKEMLVDFDYYYDLDGRFIFEQKKSYEEYGEMALSERPDGIQESFFQNAKVKSDEFYSLEDNDLVISFANDPDFNNIKNDFAIWGTREGTSGADLPVHLRFAIDQKPKSYTTYKPSKAKRVDGQGEIEVKDYPQYTYIAGDDSSWIYNDETKEIICDWREIIYQMALDYYKFHDTQSDFYWQIINNNRDSQGVSLYPDGRTHYEQYYTDILGFWRELFSPVSSTDNSKHGFFQQVLLTKSTYKRNKYYLRKRETKSVNKTEYYSDEVNRMQTFTLDSSRSYSENKIYYELIEEIEPASEPKDTDYYCENKRKYPYLLNFWFDFLDTTGELSKYSVRAIGQRPKNVNNSNVRAIYYRGVPNLIFVNRDDEEATEYYNKIDKKTAYTYVNSNTTLENCLTISSQGISAMETLQTLLNENTFCTENVTLTTIPIYHLEPNTRISIKDEESKVNGEYIINKITVPLTYNGTMSINAVKIVDDIY